MCVCAFVFVINGDYTLSNAFLCLLDVAMTFFVVFFFEYGTQYVDILMSSKRHISEMNPTPSWFI